ncbi:MAG TPA: hypothetical protein VLD18_10985, partial [Verrucomicrobiae bacterium]|nr:hypothetical protein [Verrucomicrobiae bacterium]
MSWRVVSTCPPFAQTGDESIRKLREAGCALNHTTATGPLKGDTLITALAEAEAVIAALDVFDEPVFTALPKLQLVSRWGVGF